MSEPRPAAISDFFPTLEAVIAMVRDPLPMCCIECMTPIWHGQMVVDVGPNDIIHAACKEERS